MKHNAAWHACELHDISALEVAIERLGKEFCRPANLAPWLVNLVHLDDPGNTEARGLFCPRSYRDLATNSHMHPVSILTLGIFLAGYITARWDLVAQLYELASFAWDHGVVVG